MPLVGPGYVSGMVLYRDRKVRIAETLAGRAMCSLHSGTEAVRTRSRQSFARHQSGVSIRDLVHSLSVVQLEPNRSVVSLESIRNTKI